MASLLQSISFRFKLAQVILSIICVILVLDEAFITFSRFSSDFVYLTLYSYLGIGIVVLICICLEEPMSDKVTCVSIAMKTAKSNCSIRLKRSLAVNLSIMCAFIFREMPSRNRWGPLLKRHFSYTNLGCLNIHRLVSVDNLKYVLKVLYSSILATILHFVSAVFIIKDVFVNDNSYRGQRLTIGLCTGGNAIVFGWEVLYAMKFFH